MPLNPTRFWSKFARQPNGCLEWTGARSKSGYGQVNVRYAYTDYRRVYTHRMAYELTHGAIPDGLFVLHHCDNPPCAEPTHLFLGSQADNARDMCAKGRAGRQQHPDRYENAKAPPLYRGEAHKLAKLTADDV